MVVESLAVPGLVSMVLRTLVAGYVVLLLLRYVHKILRQRWLTANIPGPTPIYPFLGNFLEVAGQQQEFMYKVYGLYKQFGTTWRLWVGDHLVVFIGEPEDLMMVCSHPALQDKPKLIYTGFELLLQGSGLLSMPRNDDYIRMRKALTPAFAFDHIRAMLRSFDKHTAELCQKLEPLASSKKMFNMVPILEKLTVDVFCDTVVSTDHTMEKERAVLAEVLKSGDKLVMWLAFRPWFHNKVLRKLFCSRSAELDWASSSIMDVVEKIYAKKLPGIELSRKRLEAEASAKRRAHQGSDGEDTDSEEHEEPPTDAKSVMDHFLSSRHLARMSDEEIKICMMHITVAGIATSSALMMMTIKIISMFPEIQKKLHEEIDEIFGSEQDRPTTEADMARLQYLERVIKEALRLFPPVHTFARHAHADVTLPTTGYVIPKGAVVAATLYHIHRDERFYPDPEVFDPDRHLPDVAAERPIYAFTPFSAGPRYCIGQKQGMIYTKAALSNILRRYRLHPSPDGPKNISDVKVLAAVSLHPVGGVNVMLERRHVPAA